MREVFIEQPEPSSGGEERASAPGRGRIVAHDDPDVVLATILPTNPLRPAWQLPGDRSESMVVAWSGTLGPDLFQPDPRTWMATGRDALDRLCDRLEPLLIERGWTLCFRPHARHVLSDVPSADRFLRERGRGPFGLALDPVSMLEPNMMDEAADHLERAFAVLGPRCSLVMVTDASPAADGNAVMRVPIGRGCLPAGLPGRLLDAHVPVATPLVLLPDAAGEQVAALGQSVAATDPRLSDPSGSY